MFIPLWSILIVFDAKTPVLALVGEICLGQSDGLSVWNHRCFNFEVWQLSEWYFKKRKDCDYLTIYWMQAKNMMLSMLSEWTKLMNNHICSRPRTYRLRVAYQYKASVKSLILSFDQVDLIFTKCKMQQWPNNSTYMKWWTLEIRNFMRLVIHFFQGCWIRRNGQQW